MADMILLGLAVICTAYFMIIVFYAGMGTSFAFIWLFFASISQKQRKFSSEAVLASPTHYDRYEATDVPCVRVVCP